MPSKSDRDNRANQLNPNNEAYYSPAESAAAAMTMRAAGATRNKQARVYIAVPQLQAAVVRDGALLGSADTGK